MDDTAQNLSGDITPQEEMTQDRVTSENETESGLTTEIYQGIFAGENSDDDTTTDESESAIKETPTAEDDEILETYGVSKNEVNAIRQAAMLHIQSVLGESNPYDYEDIKNREYLAGEITAQHIKEINNQGISQNITAAATAIEQKFGESLPHIEPIVWFHIATALSTDQQNQLGRQIRKGDYSGITAIYEKAAASLNRNHKITPYESITRQRLSVKSPAIPPVTQSNSGKIRKEVVDDTKRYLGF